MSLFSLDILNRLDQFSRFFGREFNVIAFCGSILRHGQAPFFLFEPFVFCADRRQRLWADFRQRKSTAFHLSWEGENRPLKTGLNPLIVKHPTNTISSKHPDSTIRQQDLPRKHESQNCESAGTGLNATLGFWRNCEIIHSLSP